MITRASALYEYAKEMARHGCPAASGMPATHIIVILDGVGGLLFGPLMVRRALRQARHPAATVIIDWHRGLRGDLLSDLMMLRRNRLEAAKAARRIAALKRENRAARIDLIGISGGGGIAAMTAERLPRPDLIDTLILFAPALSPAYNLAPALRHVRRCYVTTSPRDVFLLGIGTSLFGTIDRRHARAAGLMGFRRPPQAGPDDLAHYEKLRQVCWTPQLRRDGHRGGHTACVCVSYLRKHLPAMLRDEPLTPVHVGAVSP